MGQIHDPTHFPYLPVMMKDLVDPIPIREVVPCDVPLPSIQVNVSVESNPMEIEQLPVEPDRSPSVPCRLYICGSCNMNFFIRQGLEAHGPKGHQIKHDDQIVAPGGQKARAPLTIK